jgi:hypothetical protein
MFSLIRSTYKIKEAEEKFEPVPDFYQFRHWTSDFRRQTVTIQGSGIGGQGTGKTLIPWGAFPVACREFVIPAPYRDTG